MFLSTVYPMSDNVLFFVILTLMVVLALALLSPALKGLFLSESEKKNSIDHEEELRRILSADLDRLKEALAAGEISEAEFRAEKLDLERRALEECNAPEAGRSGKMTSLTQNRVVGLAVVLIVALLSFAIYARVGVPEIIGILEKTDKVEAVEGTEAMEAYLKSNPLDGRAWILMARTYVEEGNYYRAAYAYREGRKVQRNIREDVEVTLELGATLLSIGEPAAFREAQEVITEAYEKEPNNPKVTQLLIMAAAANHDWATGARELRVLLDTMKPDSPEYLKFSETLKLFEARAADNQ